MAYSSRNRSTVTTARARTSPGSGTASASITAGGGDGDVKGFSPRHTLGGVVEVTSKEFIVKSDHNSNSKGEPMEIADFAGVGNKGLTQQTQDAQIMGIQNTGNSVLEIFYRLMSYYDNSGVGTVTAAGADGGADSVRNPYLTFLLRPGQFTVMPGLRAVIEHTDQGGSTRPTPQSSAYGTSANFTLTGNGSTSGDDSCTDGTGYIESADYWGNTVTAGIVPGSICVQFYSAGYQSFGITNKTNAGKRQLPSTSSGLNTNTAYRFKCTVDGTVNNIVFTTDTSDVTWGNGVTGNGILKKINDRFLAAKKARTVIAQPRAHIVDGDCRVTSGTRLSTSAIALADSTTGSEAQMFGTNGLPHESAVDTAVAAALETPTLLKRDETSTNHLLIDQGNGTGIRADGGAFELRGEKKYNTDNTFCLKNCPPFANFKVFYNYNAAHSGPTLGNGVADNIIRKIYARSVNLGSDRGKVKLFLAY